MTPSVRTWPPAAGLVGCLSFLLVGWAGLLAPSMIRSIKDTFGQSDAGIGVLYLAFAVMWAVGSFGGGFATERLGRRTVLSLSAALLGAGYVALAAAPTWELFLLSALPAGLGSGGLDGGGNGLFLDLFRSSRGRALNLLHLFFSLGALAAPLAVGRLVEGGTAWQAIMLATGIAGFAVAGLFLAVTMPDGRHRHAALADGATERDARAARRRDWLAGPLVLLAIAIACYVAAEVGISSWLVRFLEPAPLSTATTALSLYWAGLTLGRLVSARLSDRFDHTAFAATASIAMAILLAAAILVPSLEASIALFAVAGVATGPIYPMIIAVGGDRYPSRAAAVSGLLSGTAVTGSIVYPPVMGFLSVTVGLAVAMLGTVILGLACAAALLLVGRIHPAPEA